MNSLKDTAASCHVHTAAQGIIWNGRNTDFSPGFLETPSPLLSSFIKTPRFFFVIVDLRDLALSLWSIRINTSLSPSTSISVFGISCPSGTWAWIWSSKTDVIKLNILRWSDYPDYLDGLNVITGVFLRGRQAGGWERGREGDWKMSCWQWRWRIVK